MFRSIIPICLIFICVTSSCDLIQGPQDVDNPLPDTTGTAIFDFNVPRLRGTDSEDPRYPMEIDREIHRYHLNIYAGDSLPENGSCIRCAGISRFIQFYPFDLAPGKYYYEAALICTGRNSDCNFIGFPEDNLMWSYGVFEVRRDSISQIRIEF